MSRTLKNLWYWVWSRRAGSPKIMTTPPRDKIQAIADQLLDTHGPIHNARMTAMPRACDVDPYWRALAIEALKQAGLRVTDELVDRVIDGWGAAAIMLAEADAQNECARVFGVRTGKVSGPHAITGKFPN